MSSPERPSGGMVIVDPSQEVDRPTGPEQAPTDGNVTPGLETYQVVDHLTGMYFWWDSASRTKKEVYHGRVAASLDGGYYLLEFAPSDKLPEGVHEIVHIALMAEQTWSFYRTETDYLAALRGTDGTA